MAAKKKEKQADPISERARSLNDQIASLEAEIKKLDTQLQNPAAKPKLRSTAIPHGATIPRKNEIPSPPPKPAASEPVFEEIKSKPVPSPEEAAADRYNELGVRKYDLPALWNRLRNHFRGPSASNPRLVNYLAAGGVRGLRPLRYEKRVARNRFIFLIIILFVLLLGIISLFIRHH
jgi:hypothetical protein